MDVTWFKKQQKRAGVTTADIAEIAGRDRSIVSHIYSGRQAMNLSWAKAFAQALDVPLDEVLRHAGTLDREEGRALRHGMAEGDVVAFHAAPDDSNINRLAVYFGAGRPGVDIWQVKGRSMMLGGYLPGDFILVDQHQAERCRAGDVVIAQRYDMQTGTASTILRRYEPPVLVAASQDPDDLRPIVVDQTNTVIRGKVIASWRS